MENREVIIDPLFGLGCSMSLFLTWIGAVYYGAIHSGVISKVMYSLVGSIVLWFGIVALISSINTRPLPEFLRFAVTPPVATIITVYVIWKYIPNKMMKQKRENAE